MVSVGITPTDDQIKLFNELKIEKKHRALILGLNKERNALETIKVGDRNFTLKDLQSELPHDNCRFVVYDFDYETFENPPRQTSTLLLICWAPDTSSIKIKTPFISTKGAVVGAFVGIQKSIQASDFSILNEEELRKDLCG